MYPQHSEHFMATAGDKDYKHYFMCLN